MKVLLVDDDPDLRELLGNILKTKGFETVPVETGAAALARIESPDIDVALIDLRLEDMNGMEVLRGIKERSADTECILLTGYASQATAIEAINLGAYAYFQKPYDVDQLLVAVQRAAEKRAAEEALRESEKKYHALTEISPVGVFKTDAQGSTTYVNPRWSQISGLPAEAAMGDGWLNAVPLEDREKIGANWKKAADAQIASTAEYRFVRPDGSVAWVLGLATPEKNKKNQIIGYVGTITDITERKRAEEALRASEERYRMLAENMSDTVWLMDMNLKNVYVSPSVVKLRGYTLEELNELPLDQQMTPESLNRVMQLFAENLSPERLSQRDAPVLATADLEFYKKDGTKFWSANNFVLIRDADGAPTHILGTGRDITERKQAEEALQSKQMMLARTEGIAHIGSWEWNIATDKVTWSDELFRIFQRDPREGAPSFSEHSAFYHPEEMARLRQAVETTITDGTSYELELRAIRKDGETRVCVARGIPEMEPGGRVVGLFGSFQDITERKQAEEALRESEERFRSLYENATIGIYRTTPAGDILLANPALVKMIGYDSFEEWATHNLEKEIHYEPDYPRQQFKKKIEQDGEVHGLESAWKCKDGSTIYVRESAKLIRDPHGEILYYEGIVENITERKQAEEALRLSEEKYRALVDEINDGFYATDGAGVFTFANPALARMYGFDSPEALVGRKFTDFVMPEMQAELGQAYGGAMQNGHTPEVVNGRIVRTDGTHAFVEIKSVFMIEAGQIAGWRGVMRDITKRKHAEEALLENEKKVKRLLEQQIAINQLALALGESLNLKDVYHTICERLRGLVDVWCFIVSSYDEQAREICAEYVESEEIYDVSGFPRIPLGEPGQGTQSRVIHTGQPLYTPDHQQAISTSKVRYTIEEDGSVHEELPSEKEEENTTRSVVYLPMKIEGKTVGIMQVQSTRLDAYSQEDITLLAGLANVAAVAIQNARLFQEVQHELAERKQAEEALHERLAELELLYQSGLALSQLLNPKEIGQKIIELLEQKLAWHHTAIRLYHPQNETLELLAFNQPGLQDEAEHRRVEERFNALISKVGDGLSGWVVQNLQTIRSSDLSHDPRYMETFPGLHSGLYVPMKLGDRAIGVISIESEQPNAFSEADERLVATLASQSASALENARLFEETRQRMTELETLNLISVALRAVLDREKMLAIVLEETLNALNAKNGSINLWNPETDEISQVIARGWLAGLADFSVKPGEGVFGKVFASGKPHVSMEFTSDPQTLEQSRPLLPPGWGGACVPIRSSEQVLGVFVVAVPSTRRFNQNELRLLNTLSEMAGSALYRMTLNEETLRRLRYLESLRVVDRAIAGSLDHRVTLNILLDQVISQLGLDAADVLLLNIPLQTLQFGAGQGFHTSMNKSASVRVGESFAGRAVLERCIIRVEDGETARENPSFFKFWSDEGFSRYYAVPLIAKGQVKGALEVFKRTPFTPDSDWFNFLETLASQAAIAIDNAQLFENLQNTNLDLTLAYDATIEGWSRAMDLRDEETEGHTQRVTTMAVNLAQAFGLNDDELLLLRRGALLHDIGKIGVPDHILLKPGKLTEPEWEIMRKHPQFAYEMLQPIAYLRESLDIPHCHHEKWDGTGYPQGLKGEQIPLAARIFAIVDVYDALTSDRPYRKAWTKAKTLKHIREQSGTHFDPQVVEKFMDHWEKKR